MKTATTASIFLEPGKISIYQELVHLGSTFRMPMKCVEQEIVSKIWIPDPKVSCKAFDTKIN